MGWDITYHPIKPEEIANVYFKVLEDPASLHALVQPFAIEPFYLEQLQERFEEARGFDADTPFEKGHALYLAIVAGHLRRYHYVRGSALSFLADDPLISRYFSNWENLVPDALRLAAAGNQLHENYGGGVFIDPPALQRMRADYHSDAPLRERLDELFSHGRLDVFWAAVDAAIAMECGLLEATEVVQPNPIDLNATQCASNLFHCQKEGVLLYAEAVREQLDEAARGAGPVDDHVATTPKRGWLARLFGKD